MIVTLAVDHKMLTVFLSKMAQGVSFRERVDKIIEYVKFTVS